MILNTDLQKIDINPDASTDEPQPELTTIYGYDPDSQLLSYQVETILEAGAALDDFTTLTTPPVHDERAVNVKYHPDTNLWETIDIEDPLLGVKIFAKNEIDVEIKTVMRTLITVSAQNAGLYDLKYAESIKYLEANSPTDLTDYPFLQIGVDTSSLSATDYANLIISKADEYKQKLLEMEIIRSQGKADIDAVQMDAETNIDAAGDKIYKIAEIAALKLYKL